MPSTHAPTEMSAVNPPVKRKTVEEYVIDIAKMVGGLVTDVKHVNDKLDDVIKMDKDQAKAILVSANQIQGVLDREHQRIRWWRTFWYWFRRVAAGAVAVFVWAFGNDIRAVIHLLFPGLLHLTWLPGRKPGDE